MSKALFFDIDGTLVSFATHRIPDSTLEALTLAHQCGHRIFIATGRPRILINNLGPLQEAGLIDGYITMNGGYCFVGDEVIYKSAIPHDEVRAIHRYCTERQIPCVTVAEHDICVSQADEQVRYVFHDFLKADFIEERTPEAAMSMGEIFQLTPFIREDQEQEMRPSIPHCEVGRWHPAFADITALGNTKQRGIDMMIGHLGIDLADTLAFGDGGNDVPMLRHAAIGVAMGNAEFKVKREANYVTADVDNDGIAKALRHLQIIR